jgi:hypothetical protein
MPDTQSSEKPFLVRNFIPFNREVVTDQKCSVRNFISHEIYFYAYKVMPPSP